MANQLLSESLGIMMDEGQRTKSRSQNQCTLCCFKQRNGADCAGQSHRGLLARRKHERQYQHEFAHFIPPEKSCWKRRASLQSGPPSHGGRHGVCVARRTHGGVRMNSNKVIARLCVCLSSNRNEEEKAWLS